MERKMEMRRKAYVTLTGWYSGKTGNQAEHDVDSEVDTLGFWSCMSAFCGAYTFGKPMGCHMGIHSGLGVWGLGYGAFKVFGQAFWVHVGGG